MTTERDPYQWAYDIIDVQTELERKANCLRATHEIHTSIPVGFTGPIADKIRYYDESRMQLQDVLWQRGYLH